MREAGPALATTNSWALFATRSAKLHDYGMTSKTCFIAMPVATSEDAAAAYNDKEHFVHVMDYLFVPAAERAGYEAVRPIMSGSDLIQAEIVRNLESSHLVLCDVTALNPNVFFELGIRTALDLPVALVKDDLTPRLPFDTAIINTYTYSSNLAPWLLETEIEKLANHLLVSAERANGKNSLWRYFGLTQRASAEVSPAGDPIIEKLDLVLQEVSRPRDNEVPVVHLPATGSRAVKRIDRPSPEWSDRDLLEALPTDSLTGEIPDGVAPDIEQMLIDIANIAAEISARLWLESIENGVVKLDARPFLLINDLLEKMQARAAEDDYTIHVTYGDERGEFEFSGSNGMSPKNLPLRHDD